MKAHHPARGFGALILACLCAATAPAQQVGQVRFINNTPHPRTQWARATVPFAQGVWVGLERFGVAGHECQLRPFGARWPDGSVRQGELLVRLSMQPYEERLLTVEANAGDAPRGGLSSWVQRGMTAFDWQLLVGVRGVGARTAGLRFVEVVDASPASVVLLFRARVPDSDLVYDLWLSFLAGQDHVPFELRLTCSDVTSNRWTNDIDYVLLAVNDAYPHFRGAGHRNVRPLLPPTVEGVNLLSLMGPTSLWDGQAQYWFGELLFLQPRAGDADVQARISTLCAERDEVLHGCATNWRASRAFGPFGVLPSDPPWITDGGRAAADVERDGARRWADRPASAWADMPLGLLPSAGNTGDQHDFGAAKLVDVVAGGWPQRLAEARLNASEEAFRPVHHREADGRPLVAAEHPRWVALNGRSHFSRVVSPDRLGKPFPEPWLESNGWGGKDNQHWSSLHLASTYLLTGSFALRAELDNEAELYISGHTLPSQRNVSTNSIDASRAVGRTLLSMSWNYLVTGRVDVRERMRSRVNECLVQQFIGLGVSGPVRPVTLSAPDARVFSNDVFWSPWQEALAVIGLEACAAVTGERHAHELAVIAAKTLVTYGWKVTANETIIATGVRWKADGAPLTAAEYGSRDWVLWSYGTNFTEWALSATRLTVAYGQKYGDVDMLARAAFILQRLYQRRQLPNDRGWDRFADWEAVPFQPF